MFKKISTLLISAAFLITLSTSVKAEYETCTYTEGMNICYQDGRLKSVYCNFKSDSKEDIKICQERIRENHKYKRYFRKKWKKRCESSVQKKRGEYCQELNAKFEFYRDEFLNFFLEDVPQ